MCNHTPFYLIPFILCSEVGFMPRCKKIAHPFWGCAVFRCVLVCYCPFSGITNSIVGGFPQGINRSATIPMAKQMMSSVKFALRLPVRKSAKHQTNEMMKLQNKMRLSRLIPSAAKKRFRSYLSLLKIFMISSSDRVNTIVHAFSYNSHYIMQKCSFYQ